MRIRIKFRRYGAVKYLGHLDMMRFFQKAIRRAGIDVCYSEGYSPHQIMSFAAPLGVGITSDGEYFDIEVHTTESSEAAVAALNRTMAEGIEVTGYVLLPEDAPSAMADVAAADYCIFYKEDRESPCGTDAWNQIIRDVFALQPQFFVCKKTKRSEQELDLKPLVYALSAREQADGKPSFFMRLSAGSIQNVKPELLLAALYGKAGFEYKESDFQIHRLEVYAKTGDERLVPLLDRGTPVVYP